MISPDEETDEPDSHDSSDHGVPGEDDGVGIPSEDVDYQAEGGYYQDVDLGMPEESEQVLEEEAVPSEEREEEAAVVVAIEQDQCHRGCQHGEGEDEEEGGQDEGSEVQEQREVEVVPVEEGIERLPGEDGAEEVHGADHAADTRQVEDKEQVIHRGGGEGGEGDVEDSSAVHSVVHGEGELEEEQAQREQSDRAGIQAGEDEIRRAQHHGEQDIAESTYQDRHREEEYHEQTMECHDQGILLS